MTGFFLLMTEWYSTLHTCLYSSICPFHILEIVTSAARSMKIWVDLWDTDLFLWTRIQKWNYGVSLLFKIYLFSKTDWQKEGDTQGKNLSSAVSLSKWPPQLELSWFQSQEPEASYGSPMCVHGHKSLGHPSLIFQSVSRDQKCSSKTRTGAHMGCHSCKISLLSHLAGPGITELALLLVFWGVSTIIWF